MVHLFPFRKSRFIGQSLNRQFLCCLSLAYFAVTLISIPILGNWLLERQKAEALTANAAKIFNVHQTVSYFKSANLPINWADILVTMSASRTVSCVEVVDDNKQILGVWPKSGCLASGQEIISLPQPGQNIAYILTLNYDWIYEKTIKDLAGVILVLGLILSVLLVVNAFVYHKIVATPLLYMRDNMQKRTEGGRPRLLRSQRFDEIGHIMNGYNLMLREEVRKRAQYARILRLKERQNALEKARSSLVGCVGHHIHTPMNALHGVLAVMDNLPKSKSQEQYFGILQRSAQQLSTILEDILVLAEWGEGNWGHKLTSFSMDGFLDFMIFEGQQMASQRNVSLNFRKEDYGRLNLFGPQVALRALTGRCMDYATRQSVGQRLKFSVGIEKANAADGDGVGLKNWLVMEWIGGDGPFLPDHMVDIHDISDRLGDPAILMILQLLASVEGKLTMGHTPTGDISIKVCVPIEYEVAIISDVDANQQKGQSRVPERPQRILVVDDNQTNMLVAEALLQAIGCDVTVAETPKDVETLLMNRSFDVVMLDLAMPEMDGFAMKDWIADHVDQQPYFVACSGHNSQVVRQKCADHGFEAFLPKPIDKAGLIRMLSMAVDQHDLSRL